MVGVSQPAAVLVLVHSCTALYCYRILSGTDAQYEQGGGTVPVRLRGCKCVTAGKLGVTAIREYSYSYRMPPTTRGDFVRFLLSQSLPVQGQQNGTWDRRILRPRARTNEGEPDEASARPPETAGTRGVSACLGLCGLAAGLDGWARGGR